jgi:hypothetical protein
MDLLSQPNRVSDVSALVERRALSMAITNRDLPIGTRLVADYKKTRYLCTVERAEEGESAVYTLEDGKKFKSPSAAGSAVMGGTACNGWRFWSVEGEEPPAKEAKPAAAKKGGVKTSRKARKTSTKLIYAMPDQSGVPEGMARFWCNPCMDAFEAEDGKVPEQCPQGHSADDAELTAPSGVTAEAEAAEVTA